MKDRVERTYKKKPSHRLKNAMIAMVSFTTLFSIGSAFVMNYYMKANSQLSSRIDNYNQQVEYLENQNEETLNQNRKPSQK
jgi:hypothetical protein